MLEEQACTKTLPKGQEESFLLAIPLSYLHRDEGVLFPYERGPVRLGALVGVPRFISESTRSSVVPSLQTGGDLFTRFARVTKPSSFSLNFPGPCISEDSYLICCFPPAMILPFFSFFPSFCSRLFATIAAHYGPGICPYTTQSPM